jgi:amino acid transporter
MTSTPSASKHPYKDYSAYDTTTYLTSGEPWYHDDDAVHTSYAQRILDSFKRDPSRHIIDPMLELDDASSDGVFDPHKAAVRTAHSGLARKLKGRHLQMIAIGGSIGMALASAV